MVGGGEAGGGAVANTVASGGAGGEGGGAGGGSRKGASSEKRTLAGTRGGQKEQSDTDFEVGEIVIYKPRQILVEVTAIYTSANGKYVYDVKGVVNEEERHKGVSENHLMMMAPTEPASG